MSKGVMQTVVAGLRASHFGPTVLVVGISFLLSLTQFPASSALQIALAIFAGQLVVGWSNDVIDFELDNAAGRNNKPLVSGDISIETLKRLMPT